VLQQSIVTHLYDPKQNAFKDSPNNYDLYPQDANALAVYFNVVPSYEALKISKFLTNNWTPLGPEPPELPGNISPFISSFELLAHFSQNETFRALDLLRRTWGWYLGHKNGTESTFIEGYRTDGTFGYRAERGYQNDPSYTSHSHGWSAGPTGALTKYIAGLNIENIAGSEWSMKPQFALLEFAEAGFITPLGVFRSKWAKLERDSGYNITIETPVRTRGVIHLPPLINEAMTVLVNGTKPDAVEGGYGMTLEVNGGNWNITVRPAT
jgi:hypothetical protein